jgi:hypothetical protein
MMVHTERCEYGILLKRIEGLELALVEKDKEITRLQKEAVCPPFTPHNQLTPLQESHTSSPNVHNILESISRGIDKLDEDRYKRSREE